MAQTTQVDETGGGTETPPADGQGILSPTTLLLLVVVLAFFLWSRRRRTAMEERLQAQRRERAEVAEQSAMNVAHIMRRPVTAESAAAATEGLASAARMPAAPRPETRTDHMDDGALAEGPIDNGVAPEDISRTEASRARVMERAEAAAAAERAAEEQAALAAQAANLGGESAERRVAAGEAAAEEARADTADALRAQDDAVAGDQEPGAADVPRAAMRDLDDEDEPPLGAIAGDGTAICPPDFPIKGKAISYIYHEPGQSLYAVTIADFCFASAGAAEAAGFRQSRARGHRAQE